VGFLVDPFAETVSDVHERLEALDEGDYLAKVREMLAGPWPVQQLRLIGFEDAGGVAAMFVDNWGMLRGEKQRVWQFKDGPGRIAGKALILAVDPRNGFLAPIRSDVIEIIRDSLQFLPDVVIAGIDEHIVVNGPGKYPHIGLNVRFSDDRADDGALVAKVGPPPAPAAADEIFRWVVSARADRTVKAERYVLGADGDAPVLTRMISAPDLEELHKLLPGNLVRHDPADDDPPEILEYLAPPPAPTPTPFDHDHDEEAAV
jgi:hypothetical protein